ncbi:hypothetical protein [Rhizobium sp. BK068]|uniref:hypothetical protein n=1 Tax=Rhizobium sp. BK068 TaxID=2512130 RepID=UPI0010442456|nr:hypothetical protein [Rhizobium sp. BK068]
MATLVQLVDSGIIRPVLIPLKRSEFANRLIYGFPEFRKWLENDVKNAEAFYRGDLEPKRQAYAILKDFITGKPFPGPKLYKKMRPVSDEVWELRTPDLRFFGWFVRKDCLIVVSGALFINLKADSSLYEEHRLKCIRARNDIDLDPPKCLQGAEPNDVIS